MRIYLNKLTLNKEVVRPVWSLGRIKDFKRMRHFLYARILDDIIKNKRDRLASFKQGDLFSNILDFFVKQLYSLHSIVLN